METVKARFLYVDGGTVYLQNPDTFDQVGSKELRPDLLSRDSRTGHVWSRLLRLRDFGHVTNRACRSGCLKRLARP